MNLAELKEQIDQAIKFINLQNIKPEEVTINMKIEDLEGLMVNTKNIEFSYGMFNCLFSGQIDYFLFEK
jgi:hypothetical protein